MATEIVLSAFKVLHTNYSSHLHDHSLRTFSIILEKNIGEKKLSRYFWRDTRIHPDCPPSPSQHIRSNARNDFRPLQAYSFWLDVPF